MARNDYDDYADEGRGSGFVSSETSKCLNKMFIGAQMGAALGLSFGAVFGTYSVIRAGVRGREGIHVVGRSMLQTSGVVAGFLAVATGFRGC